MYTKVSVLSANISVHKFHIICLSQTYLNSKATSHDNNLKILRHYFIREVHPSISKRGGVCIFYWNTVRFEVSDVNIFKKVFDWKVGEKLHQFICFCSSACQKYDKFETLLKNIKLGLDKTHESNLLMPVASVDFHAKSKSWCKNGMTSLEDWMIDTERSNFSLRQLICGNVTNIL